MSQAVAREEGLIRAVNPATLEIIKEIPAISADGVRDAVEKARDAQKKWASAVWSEKMACFSRIRDVIVKDMDKVAAVITADNGKTRVESVNSEIFPVLDMLRFCMKEAPKILKEERLDHPLFGILGIKSSVIYEPLGVIGIIAPWNFPFCIPMTQILMAIAAGNTVVFKPAALTAVVGELIESIFKKAKLAEGVVNVAQGSGSVVGNAIMRAGVDRLAFTGSVPVGKALMKKAAEMLMPITLELGGKDPFIVLDDADLERASSGAVWGAFVNAGQVCASVERVYAHKKIAARFIEMVVEKTKRLRVGNGMDFSTDMGPLIDKSQVCLVEAHVEDAMRKGARVLAGGRRAENLKGHFFEPTVIVDVNHDMECMTEETFGPTMPIMTYSDIDEAVYLANDSRFALTASVWSRDENKAKDICRKLTTGCVTVNDCEYTYGFAVCPWGGPKESGLGRTHSAHGFREFTNMKNLCVTTPRLKKNLWWHPYSEHRYEQMKAFATGVYGKGIAAKCALASSAVKSILTQ